MPREGGGGVSALPPSFIWQMPSDAGWGLGDRNCNAYSWVRQTVNRLVGFRREVEGKGKVRVLEFWVW
jgi:hypothetical protein